MNKFRIMNSHRQKGSALVTVLLLITVLGILTAASAAMVMNAQKNTKRQFVREGQASNVARGGIQSSLNWFKSQVAQPVRQDTGVPDQTCSIHRGFYPRQNISQPDLGYTLDESKGLVKEFKLQEPNIYGQYLIRRYNCALPDTDPWNKSAVRDITFRRGKNSGTSPPNQGVVWYLESEGTVYVKNNPALAPGVGVNKVLDRRTAAVEINRVSLNVQKAPIALTSASGSTFNNRCQALGDNQTNFGIIRNSITPNPGTMPQFSIPVTYTSNYQIATASENITVQGTFNMSVQEIKSVSDKIFTDVTQISSDPDEPIPFGLTFLEGNGSTNFVFTSARPLRGSGILFVNGDLELQTDSNSSFSGLIYITGHLRMGASNGLSGAVVAGRMTCNPATSTTLEYNDNIMTNVRQRLGLYRQNNLTLNITN